MGWTEPAVSVSARLMLAAALLLASAATGLAQGCDVELTLDAPADGAEVTPQQRLSGWAVDRAAPSGSGIQAVRVAFDVVLDRASDRLFTPLPTGLARPDVASAFGNPRFATAGFAQDWAAFSLAPGPHQLILQAHSACGWTTVVRTVRMRSDGGEVGSAPDALGPARSSEVQDAPPPVDDPAPKGSGAAASPLSRVPAPSPYGGTHPARFSLSAVPAGSSGATLTWTAVPGASAYNVYLSEDGGPPTAIGPGSVPRPLGLNGMLRVQSGVVDTTTLLAGLNAGSTYRFVVRAVNGSGGETSESETAQITLPSQPPNALTATVSGGGIALSWSEVPGAVTYTVLAGVGNRPLVPDPQRTNLTAASTTIDRVGFGTYRFQIEARDAAGGRVARSNVAQVLLDPATLAGAPPPASAVGPGLPPGGPMPANASSAAPGPLSASVGGVWPAYPPGAPAGGGADDGQGGLRLGVDRAGPSGVKLVWSPLRGVGSYAIYQAQGTTPLAYVFSTGSTSTTLSGLAQGVTYSFQVRARDTNDQEVATSNTVSFTPGQ